jgi:hypothetical protein
MSISIAPPFNMAIITEFTNKKIKQGSIHLFVLQRLLQRQTLQLRQQACQINCVEWQPWPPAVPLLGPFE